MLTQNEYEEIGVTNYPGFQGFRKCSGQRHRRECGTVPIRVESAVKHPSPSWLPKSGLRLLISVAEVVNPA